MKPPLKIAGRFIPIPVFRSCAALVLAVSMGTIEPAHLAVVRQLTFKGKGTTTEDRLSAKLLAGPPFLGLAQAAG
jgi:hypothetical protein